MSDLYKHLTGIVQEFPCQQCGFNCYTVITSQIHYHRCPTCYTEHELEIISLDIKVKPIPDNDLGVVLHEAKL